MVTRAAGFRFTFTLTAALIMGSAVQAQVCANNPTVGAGDTCFGDSSMLAMIPGGCCGTASADTAFGYGTLRHNTTGAENTAIGSGAQYWTTTGNYNTSVGYTSMMNNRTGERNTAVGAISLTGPMASNDNTAVGYMALSMGGNSENTAVGSIALPNNTSGSLNSAFGWGALYASGSGSSNTAIGGNALSGLGSGSSNLALGVNAGQSYAAGESNNVLLANVGVYGESGVIRIGTPGTIAKAFVAGIYGATTASGTWVMVNNAGQLGTTTSSLRFKEEVADMGASSSDLMRLRPVTFRYKAPYDDGQRVLQYGLIAEEVAAVNPGLVQFGDDGKPLAVRYHFVDAMLLNEVQQQHSSLESQSARLAAQAVRIEAQAAEIAEQKGKIASQEAALAELAARLAKLEAR